MPSNIQRARVNRVNLPALGKQDNQGGDLFEDTNESSNLGMEKSVARELIGSTFHWVHHQFERPQLKRQKSTMVLKHVIYTTNHLNKKRKLLIMKDK